MPHASGALYSSLQLPDRLVAAAVRGNVEVPQIYSGAIIRMGALGLRLVLEDKTSWKVLQAGNTSYEQALRVGEAMNAAHAKWGIAPLFDPAVPDGTNRRERKDGKPPLVSMENLVFTVGSAQAGISKVAFRFGDLAAPVLAGPDARLESATELFTDSRYKPATIALANLFGLAEAVLKRPDVLKEAAAYRAAIEAARDDRGELMILRADEELKMYSRLKESLGSAAVRVQIARASGFEVSAEMIETFILHTSLYFGKRLQEGAAYIRGKKQAGVWRPEMFEAVERAMLAGRPFESIDAQQTEIDV